jgi:transcription elongation factor Elf1
MKEFDINQTDAKGRKTTRPSCRICRVSIDGKRITMEESKRLNAIKPKDIFTCPICGKKSIVGITANLVKDHDHRTGKGREWICDSCNTGLGRFKDDISLFQRVINYLKKHS